MQQAKKLSWRFDEQCTTHCLNTQPLALHMHWHQPHVTAVSSCVATSQARPQPKRLSQLAGMVYYNQEAATSHIYANLVALLPRENPLEAALTVAQNLQLAADLALPPHFTRHRKACLIEEVLDLLALRPLQHCLVGSPPHAGGLWCSTSFCHQMLYFCLLSCSNGM